MLKIAAKLRDEMAVSRFSIRFFHFIFRISQE